jgi:hypothetical protein
MLGKIADATKIGSAVFREMIDDSEMGTLIKKRGRSLAMRERPD